MTSKIKIKLLPYCQNLTDFLLNFLFKFCRGEIKFLIYIPLNSTTLLVNINNLKEENSKTTCRSQFCQTHFLSLSLSLKNSLLISREKRREVRSIDVRV